CVVEFTARNTLGFRMSGGELFSTHFFLDNKYRNSLSHFKVPFTSDKSISRSKTPEFMGLVRRYGI
ncbi:MAG: hypothetical protein ACXVB4_08650, partial [Pseudobdellovibrionaceae bacterium]